MRITLLIVTCFFFSEMYAQRLVLPGDNADPSVVKIGDTYWASATTSNWFPAYPLLHSKDLINWKQQGYVFTKKPEWADYYFWAPEISYENNKVYIYYSAHKKGGNLCVGIASADRPEGPYTDHGPLICEAAGSIDAFPMRDENGKLFIIWKEDGNSVNQPTPIWAQELNEERTALIGEKKELFRNDLPWEGNLVEGVSMIRKNGYFYAFYAAAGCCGIACTYNSGVARAKSLLGPWEKYEKNPLLVNSGQWICPGHGTPVEKDGRYYFLYHAYKKSSNIYTGRQGLLQEFEFTGDDWIRFKSDSTLGDARPQPFSDSFEDSSLNQQWQWNVKSDIEYSITNGVLSLGADTSVAGSYLGTKIQKAAFTATAKLANGSTAAAGLALLGDEFNTLSIEASANTLRLLQVKAGIVTELNRVTLKSTRNLYLRIHAGEGQVFDFGYSLDGKKFISLPADTFKANYLPPWDRALRVGLVSKGEANGHSKFDDFQLQYE